MLSGPEHRTLPTSVGAGRHTALRHADSAGRTAIASPVPLCDTLENMDGLFSPRNFGVKSTDDFHPI